MFQAGLLGSYRGTLTGLGRARRPATSVTRTHHQGAKGDGAAGENLDEHGN